MSDTARINVGNAEQPVAAEARAAHEAEMVRKAEGLTFSHSDSRTGAHVTNKGEAPAAAPEAAPAASEASTRPEGVPEKFWDATTGAVNVDALLKSQQELEKQFTQSRQKASEGAPAAEETSAPAEAQDSAVAKARSEFAETGTLTADTYAALEKTGLDRSTVDSYIQGQQAQVETLKQAAYEQTGGEEGFTQMAEWARGELSENEIAALDHLLASTDPKVIAEGARQLAEKYNSNAPVEPTNTVHGQAAPGGIHYRSRAEMVKDMSSKQYQNDPAFRAEVATKVARASRAGVDLYG